MNDLTGKKPKATLQTQLSPIITYTNLLHQFRDPAAKEVQKFRRRHAHDRVFLKRADVLDKVFKLKAELTTLGS